MSQTSAVSTPEAEMSNLSIAEPRSFNSSHDTLDFAPSPEQTTPLRVEKARRQLKFSSLDSPTHKSSPFAASRSTSLLADSLSPKDGESSTNGEGYRKESPGSLDISKQRKPSTASNWEANYSDSAIFRKRPSVDLREAAFDSPLSSLRQSSGDNHSYIRNSITPEFPSDIIESFSERRDQEPSGHELPSDHELSKHEASERNFSKGFEDIDNIMSPRGLLSFDTSNVDATRKLEERVKHLESDKLDLQLKLQEYRDNTSSKTEISRVISQLRRAETRIVDLENALDRKNDVIQHLSLQAEGYTAQQDRANEAEKVARESQEYAKVFQEELSHAEEARHRRDREVSSALSALEHKLPEIFHGASNYTSGDEGLKYLVERTHALANDAADIASHRNHLQEMLHKIGGFLGVSDSSDISRAVMNLLEEKANLEYTVETQASEMNENVAKYSQEAQALREKLAKVSRGPAEMKVLNEELNDLREELQRQHEQGASASKHFYYLVSSALSTINDTMGPEFRKQSDSELQNIITEARATNTSKIPRLAQLLLRYISNLSADARRGGLSQDLQSRVKELESLLAIRLDRLGADRVLRAQLDDLQATLKLEREKRKSEYEEAQATISRLAAM